MKTLYLILLLTLVLFGCTFYPIKKIEFRDYVNNVYVNDASSILYRVSRPFPSHQEPKIEATATTTIMAESGKASYYNYKLKGYPNYSKENFTAASRDFPRGTELLVCRTDARINIEDIRDVVRRKDEGRIYLNQSEYNINKCVRVRVNDFGPEHCKDNKDACPERIIDLSSKAFSELAPLSVGLIDVEITKL